MKWFDFIKNIIDQCGLSCFWNDINGVNTKWLVETIKMNLKDQFKQTWLTDLNTNNKCINYIIFKPNFGFEDYNIIGDEFHFILECTVLNELRFKLLPKHCHNYPNIIKFSSLLNFKSIIILKKICEYVEEGLKLF